MPRKPTPGGAHRREAAVLAAIQAFRRAFSAFHRRLSAASQGEISMADVFVLHFVAHLGDVSPGDIGDFTGLTSGSVTTVLDRLEEAGYVVRSRSTQDRRVVVVNLRPGARQRLASTMLHAHAAVGQMFEGWSTKDVEQLVGLLDRLKLEPDAGKAG